MRLHRFYVNQLLGEEIVTIDSLSLIHQLTSVFRYKINNEVILFSGDGIDYQYSILSSSKKEIILTLKNKSKSVLIEKSVTLYMSLVKKDTFENIVRICTELGVTRFVPVIADRSEKKNLNMERLENIAIEATEQCGRGDVPTISPIISLEKVVNDVSENDKVIVASLFGKSINSDSIKKVLKNNKTSIFIGPEGGFSDEEEKVFDNKHFTKLKLTETVLKADTAAQIAVSLVILA